MTEQTIVEMKPRSFWGGVTAFFGFVVMSVLCGALITSTTVPFLFLTATTKDQAVDIISALPDDLIIDPLMEKTHIYAKNPDGGDVLLATFYDQNREPVAWENVSENMKDAIIATEDPRFYEHGGVDIIGVTRAVASNAFGGSLQGASSVTQQYVKNVFIQKAERITNEEEKAQAYEYATEETIGRKLREARYSIALEKKYSKDEILLGYMNIVNFGGTTYGIEAASKYYFGVTAKDLSLTQAATLTAIVNNPSNLRIDRPGNEVNGAADGYSKTLERRNYVLYSMLREKKITEDVYLAAKEEPVSPKITQPKTGCSSAGGSAYFCDYVTKEIQNNPTFGATPEERLNLLKQGGLKIYTTIDLNLQLSTERSIAANAPRTVPGMDFGAASISVQPGTGRILAMAQNKDYSTDANAESGKTGINYNTNYNYGGSSGFQVGSTYKIFTLLEWLNSGHTLSQGISGKGSYDYFNNSCTDGWYGDFTFKNYDGSRSSYGNASNATRNSINTAFVEMAHQMDLCKIVNMATNFGVTRANNAPLIQEPSAVLGTDEISPLSIATAFAGLSAGGNVCQPVAIDRILDSEGNEIEVPNGNCTQVVSPGVAGAAIVALQGVISGGTATASNLNDGIPMFGKTGTTDSSKHAWMSGATSEVATSVWTGNVVGSANLNNRYIDGIPGGQVRHRIFSGVMSSANGLYGGTGFVAPDGSLL